MLDSSDKELYILNKSGTKGVKIPIPRLLYLQTEKDFINSMLARTDLDGISFVIDWSNKSLIMQKYG